MMEFGRGAFSISPLPKKYDLLKVFELASDTGKRYFKNTFTFTGHINISGGDFFQYPPSPDYLTVERYFALNRTYVKERGGFLTK